MEIEMELQDTTCIALRIIEKQQSSRIMDEFYEKAMRQVALYGAAYYRITEDGWFEFYDPRDIYIKEDSE